VVALSEDCLFCRIASNEEPADHVGADEGVVAIRDKFPQAPVHDLVIPVEHIASVHELTEDHGELLARCFRLARRVAEHEGISDGYRVTTNVGTRGGQAIPHLHFHVIGGRQLGRIDDRG
jgi:histidine triad (HIT) family protein